MAGAEGVGARSRRREGRARACRRGVAALAVSGLFWAVPPAFAEEAGARPGGPPKEGGEGPAVEISADAGRLGPGAGVEYTVTVANTGGAPLSGAVLAYNLPPPLEVVGIGGDGVQADDIVSWPLSLGEGESAEYLVRVRVAESAAPGTPVSSTACLLVERGRPPAACATDAARVVRDGGGERDEGGDRAEGEARAVGAVWSDPAFWAGLRPETSTALKIAGVLVLVVLARMMWGQYRAWVGAGR